MKERRHADTHKAHGRWEGGLKAGKGRTDFGGGAFPGAYSLASRFEHGAGTDPHGHPEHSARALALVARMDEEGLGNCAWHGERQAACPKSISIDTIARVNGE